MAVCVVANIAPQDPLCLNHVSHAEHVVVVSVLETATLHGRGSLWPIL
jgi:hypothetical protein